MLQDETGTTKPNIIRYLSLFLFSSAILAWTLNYLIALFLSRLFESNPGEAIHLWRFLLPCLLAPIAILLTKSDFVKRHKFKPREITVYFVWLHGIYSAVNSYSLPSAYDSYVHLFNYTVAWGYFGVCGGFTVTALFVAGNTLFTLIGGYYFSEASFDDHFLMIFYGVSAIGAFLSNGFSYHLREQARRAKELAELRLQESKKARAELLRQTQHMQTILSGIDQGICIIDSEFRMNNVHSKALTRIIGNERIENDVDPISLIFTSSNLGSDQQDRIRNVLRSCLGEESISLILNISHLPRITTLFRDNDQMHVEIDWHPVLDEAGIIRGIIIVMRDTTHLLNLRKEYREASVRQDAFLEIVDTGFMGHECLRTSLCRAIESLDLFLNNPNLEKMKVLQFHLHATKGDARMFRMVRLASFVHELESVVETVGENKGDCATNEALEQCRDGHTRLRVYFDILDLINRQNSSLQKQSLETFSHVAEVVSRLEFRQLNPSFSRLLSSVSTILRDPATRRLFDALEVLREGIFNEARESSLTEPFVNICCPLEIFISGSTVSWVLTLLEQVIRNTFSHGFSQDEQGIIWINVIQSGSHCRIHYRTSENGLDLVGLRKKAEEHGYSFTSDEELVEALFIVEMSTAISVTERSGRGVGIRTARNIARENGGEFSIMFKDKAAQSGHRPFEFVVTIPDSQVSNLNCQPESNPVDSLV